MKKLAFLATTLFVTGCLHDVVEEPEKITGEVEYPALSSQQVFDALQENTVAKQIDKDNAEELISTALIRIMNVLEIANQEIDQVSANHPVTAVYKPQARALTPLWARSENCKNEENAERLNTEALVWDDVNDDNQPLGDDKWYLILEQCRNNANSSSYVTGVILYSGIDDPFNEQGLQTDDTFFSNYQYTLDIQVDFSGSLNAFYQNTSIVLSREENSSGDEVTNMLVKSGSKLGVNSDDNLYLFNVDSISSTANEDELTLGFNFNGDYLATLEIDDEVINESLSVSTEEELVFSFEFNANQLEKIHNVKLDSGEFKLLGDSSSATLSVKDETTLSIDVDDDGDGISDTTIEIDQTDIFEHIKFRLLNITGG